MYTFSSSSRICSENVYSLGAASGTGSIDAGDDGVEELGDQEPVVCWGLLRVLMVFAFVLGEAATAAAAAAVVVVIVAVVAILWYWLMVSSYGVM